LILAPPPTARPYTYHNYALMMALLTEYANRCPNITRLSSIGTSQKGKKIWSMELSITSHLHDNIYRHSVGLVGSLQGKDVVGRELLLTFIEYLCEGYKRHDTRVIKLLKTTRINIIPSVDVDGNDMAQEGDCEGKTHPQDDLSRSFYYDTMSKQKRDLPDKLTSVSK
jgi:murein tripeptide amidase MpaA